MTNMEIMKFFVQVFVCHCCCQSQVDDGIVVSLNKCIFNVLSTYAIRLTRGFFPTDVSELFRLRLFLPSLCFCHRSVAYDFMKLSHWLNGKRKIKSIFSVQMNLLRSFRSAHIQMSAPATVNHRTNDFDCTASHHFHPNAPPPSENRENI